MKYLVKFNESVDNMEWAVPFDNFISMLYDIIDEDEVNVSFSTADGSRKHMYYDDYSKKNDDYKMFIIALGGMSVEFTVRIAIGKDDYDMCLRCLSQLKGDRIESSDWSLIEFTLNGFKEKGYKSGFYIIDATFKWYDSNVHGKKQTYNITGE